MQPELSLQEKEIILQILALQHHLEHRFNVEVLGDAPGDQIPGSKKEDLLSNAGFLAQNGLHRMALEAYGELIDAEADLYLAIALAKSALLGEDLAVARVWADRALVLLKEMLAQDPLPDFAYWMFPLLHGLGLTKVYHVLGEAETVATLRTLLKPLVQHPRLHTDYLFDCLRLTVELGFHEEAVVLLLQMATFTHGHSRGNLWNRCFRTLLEKGHEHFAWAVLGMTNNDDGLEFFHYVAMEEAVEMEEYILAVRFAARNGVDGKWSGLAHLAKCLVRNGKIGDWERIWDHIIDQKQWGKFSSPEYLKYLAVLMEHFTVADRLKALETAKRYDENTPDIPNRTLAEEMRALCFVIYAWTAEEDVVRAMLPTVDLPKDFLRSTLRAALRRGFEFLVDQVNLKLYPNIESNPILQLGLAHERMLAGQDNELEELYETIKNKAMESQDTRLLSTMGNMISWVWKDLDRFLKLHEEISQRIGSKGYLGQLGLKGIAKKGDLAALQRWLERTEDTIERIWTYQEVLETCLDVRLNLRTRIEDF